MSDIYTNTDGWKAGGKVTITRGLFVGHLATLKQSIHIKGGMYTGGDDLRTWLVDMHHWEGFSLSKYAHLSKSVMTNSFTDGWMDEIHREQLYKLWNK